MIALTKESIFDVVADVIVNPANSFLRHGGGLAAAIQSYASGSSIPGTLTFAGPEPEGGWTDEHQRKRQQWQDDHEKAPLIPTGGVLLTSPGLMPFEACLHAVGPIWGDGSYLETELHEHLHDRIFETVEAAGFDSVVLPAISCGIFGFPVPAAACIAVQAARWANVDVTFALPDPEHYAAWTQQLGDPLFVG